jgi:hypothetical protein
VSETKSSKSYTEDSELQHNAATEFSFGVEYIQTMAVDHKLPELPE